jgi:hypothetical protein
MMTTNNFYNYSDQPNELPLVDFLETQCDPVITPNVWLYWLDDFEIIHPLRPCISNYSVVLSSRAWISNFHASTQGRIPWISNSIGSVVPVIAEPVRLWQQ